MAEGDTRIETLEDELKVLKGEVRRTLVDLRALLMREDSPLNENAIARRLLLARSEGGGDAQPVVPKAAPEMVKQATPEAAAPSPTPAAPPVVPPPQNPMWGGGSGYQPPQPPPSPDPAIAGREREMADQQRRLDEQERRMAEQERRLADGGRESREGGERAEADQKRRLDEQERRMAEQERRLADAGRESREGGERAEADQKRRLDEQERRMEEQERRLADARREAREIEERTEAAGRQDPPPPRMDRGMEREKRDDLPKKQDRPNALRIELEPLEEAQDDALQESLVEIATGDLLRDQSPEVEEQPEPIIAIAMSSRKKPSMSHEADDDPNLDYGEDIQAQNYEDEDPEAMDDKLLQKRPTGVKPRKRSRREEIFLEEDGDERQPDAGHSRSNSNSLGSAGHGNGNGRGSRVYQEYTELLRETEDTGSENHSSAGNSALDVNLISSLTRWAVIAKQRVDSQRLNQILDLYAQLGHLTPDLRGLLTQIIALVGENHLDPAPVSSVLEVEASTDGAQSRVHADAQSCIDLIFHLRGVLAGSPAIRPVTTPKVANPVA